MRLDSVHITSLRKNLNKIIVGKEVESGESSSLRTEVILEALLDLFEFLVVLLEFLQNYTTVSLRNDFAILLCLSHVIFPEFID